MLFERKKELQSLVNASRKSLLRAEEKIKERNKLIENQQEEIKRLRNKVVDLGNNLEFVKGKELPEEYIPNDEEGIIIELPTDQD